MKITMKDIAEEAKVSIATVSHVLNNKPGRVSDAMREKIKKIAREKKYVTNHTARQLATNKSNTIGIIVPDLENYFFASMVSRLQAKMRERGYFVLVVTSNDEIRNDLEGIRLLVSRGIDLLAISVSNAAQNHPEEYLSMLEDLSVPAIMIDRIIKEFKGSKIRFDDFSGMNKLTEYVIDNHHRKIAFLNGDMNMARTAGRIQGFLASMEAHGCAVDQKDIYDGDYSFESGYALFDAIYDQHTYTAIIAANDMMAYGLMNRAIERGLTLPDDISISGYDNVIFSEMLNPSLTTVNQDMNSLMDEVLRVIDLSLKDPHYSENIIIDTQLIKRNSVGSI
ncbi:LacI family DNA-binding transcriptional regulator [Proteiniclasticum sp. SCR006]|uniref:LacI family DNA-binding transcriptional regulator n=1 Tax=Proteiniclasticum aestuarii TaxID=2817862 RepID=A0A939KJF4_9CLOT|nr:LacI family DNA-binding transcriptional regulator [Proteiniclasticum aestuarii]MBO1265108.1 LacI family DNA-binding transcriptional regulator [Proteiniclasticum aestuarii]